ncbi:MULTISPECIES: CaiB/BaiF CoA transferase family protein [Rhodococcus]|uniref:CaiB/BaiF CoA-transferase family protein n=1 Tax=Rhodococcus globerulus TaxID=33008 RepID=A0ABU4C1I6_RHOGO|nr:MULTISPECIES: CaiB/BaiF CoA-transferase family protein [Rhodococcus]MDV6270367.1 CaiB/BaiF CoA-transferase family protein [Rhodococcus globerulus]MDV8064962.1 CaiB/BaiF CoA-transferase family protein [Rhodococcus sp. IEGM 1366]
MGQSHSDLPLDGITVVALEQAVAAPLASRHLADMGARVIKIERVGEGDFARHYDGAVRGQGSHFVWLNRSKESIAVDVKSESGRRVVLDLIAEADVFLQNLAPDAADRLGFGADTLRAEFPRLIVINMSGYGSAGPRRERKAYDMLVQAETGMISVTGTPETATKTGVPVSDIAAGMYALTSILGALFRRERTGKGATVDVSMFDATVEWLGHPMYMKMYADKQIPRVGLGHAAIVPYDSFPTSDGQILIGVQNERGWRTLMVDVFGREDLVDHPRYATNIVRVENRAEVDEMVGSLTRLYSTAELDKRLAAAGVPAAALNDMGGLLKHPQLDERSRWRSVGTEVGPIDAVLPPMTFSDVEMKMGDVPSLGQHTESILTELGRTADQIADLHRDGSIG